MTDPTPTIAAALASAFEDYRSRVHTLATGLTDAQFWARPYPYGNSMGHLTLHLTGNLNFYIGTQMAGTGYVRDRDREFGDPTPPSKAEALQRLDAAVDLTVRTIRQQTAGDWSVPYSAPGADGLRDRFSMFLRVAAHFHHHTGQMIYLAKEHARQAESGGDAPARYAHTNLVARDWRALGRFYEQALGCVPLAPERDLSGEWLERGTGVPGARITGAHYRLPGGGPSGPTLEIFQYHPPEEAAAPPANRVGFGHIAFAVDDVEASRAAVVAAGGVAVGTVESIVLAGAGRITWTYVRDPEGNLVELQKREA
jgi:catechol 2,3-dioxygenase-like lactoylglutathione lyase family enzyme